MMRVTSSGAAASRRRFPVTVARRFPRTMDVQRSNNHGGRRRSGDQQRQRTMLIGIGEHRRLQRRSFIATSTYSAPIGASPRTSSMRPSRANRDRKRRDRRPRRKPRRSIVSSTSGGMSETASMRRLSGLSARSCAPTLSKWRLRSSGPYHSGRCVQVRGAPYRLPTGASAANCCENGDGRNVDRHFRHQHEGR